MNSPAPVNPSSTNVAPTLGALLGTSAGLIVASKLHLDPTDVTSGGALVATVSTLFTALFHWLGQKTGIPGLG